MTDFTTIDTLHGEALAKAAEQAVRAIAPAWPLTATVAVNPFLGQISERLETTASRLARIGGVRLALPRAHYRQKITSGEIADEDLLSALAATASGFDLDALKAAVADDEVLPQALPTVADLAARHSGTDWPGLIADRIGSFAAGFFDEGQALWAASTRNGLYAAWRAFATHDLTPEILGLTGFGAHVAGTPETAQGAIERAAVRLGLARDPGTYFHQLLLGLGGWAQHARHLQWKAELDGRTDTTALELLAVRLVFEEALFTLHRSTLGNAWRSVRTVHGEPLKADRQTVVDTILQLAAERSAQRQLGQRLACPSSAAAVSETRPFLQAAFCIDVRSEVFRRSLEAVDSGIRTFGFAGFFGMGISHRGFASDVAEHRLPVLLKPQVFSCSAVEDEGEGDRQARFRARAARAWGRFKLAAVSSFAFVEAMGPVYAGKLMRDGLGFAKGHGPDSASPRFSPDLDLATRATMAETVLRAMSLTENFGRFILLCGHGANVVNNAFASALHCGACGGNAGDVNARLLALLLNDGGVRDRLALKGILVPEDTLFLAGLHDTTTDAVTLFVDDIEAEAIAGDLSTIRRWLQQSGALARAERANRLQGASPQSIASRSRDWSQVRPELGLAGCSAFVAAPRHRTQGRSLEGRAFLHDYDWRQDEGFKTLELILTAPVVVASWISLQYFGSTVAPSLFGAGNKLLHNIVGGIGVVEGNGGTLRAGLPWQSVHDGSTYLHEPLRLTVAVEAPREAITAILQRHDGVRALFDNDWLHLFALDEKGRMAFRYDGQGCWVVSRDGADLPEGSMVQAS
jgi:uncharacterized protein YbcC (UPF0753/DUF2309 family)